MILQHDLFFLLYPTIPPNLRLKWQQICWSGFLIFHTFHAEEISIGLIVTFTALVMMRRLGESFDEKILCTYMHICICMHIYAYMLMYAYMQQVLKTFSNYLRVFSSTVEGGSFEEKQNCVKLRDWSPARERVSAAAYMAIWSNTSSAILCLPHLY